MENNHLETVGKMEEIKEILRKHFDKYLEMTAQDAIKLLYQHCFGCEHLIKDEESALSMLKSEWNGIEEDNEQKLWEDIGNGYGRLNLRAAKAKQIPLETVGKIFIDTAKTDRKKDLSEAISVLEQMAREGQTPFSCEDLKVYLSYYNGKAVHHSEKYRECYHPSYRIVDKNLAKTYFGVLT